MSGYPGRSSTGLKQRMAPVESFDVSKIFEIQDDSVESTREAEKRSCR